MQKWSVANQGVLLCVTHQMEPALKKPHKLKLLVPSHLSRLFTSGDVHGWALFPFSWVRIIVVTLLLEQVEKTCVCRTVVPNIIY